MSAEQERNVKFKFNDRVRITDGFYKGTSGEVDTVETWNPMQYNIHIMFHIGGIAPPCERIVTVFEEHLEKIEGGE